MMPWKVCVRQLYIHIEKHSAMRETRRRCTITFFFYSERLIFIFVAAHHLPPDPSLILDSCSLTIISSASTAERSGIRRRNGDAVFPRCAPCIFLIGESIHSPVFFPQLIANKYRYPTPLSPLQRPYALPAALPHHFVSHFPE